MTQGNTAPSVSEAKLAWSYALLTKAFTDLCAAFARNDPEAAWGTVAATRADVAQAVREEDARLVAKGFGQGEMKEVSDRLNATLITALQAINDQRGLVRPALRARNGPSPQRQLARR